MTASGLSATEFSSIEQGFMQSALNLARRGLGKVAPNPAVGCVIVREGQVVGRGWTQPGGRPHAEAVALAQAGESARGATAYVTLEPCAHHGKTPPCAEALVSAGITRCVVACGDPDERVSGKGLEILRKAGVTVDFGLMESEALSLNRGFFSRVSRGRPMVTVKVATTLDGRIATKRGESKWITGDLARQASQMLRVEHDAILVGSGTALADNPRLDVRLPGLESFSPLRVIMDGRLRLPLTSDLVARAAECPTCLMTFDENDSHRLKAYEDAGVKVVHIKRDDTGFVCPLTALDKLGEMGITRLLVEGGSHVIGSLLRQGLVDEIVWFRAAKVIGGDGLPVMTGFGLENLADAPQFRLVDSRYLGEDRMEHYCKTG
ncbi:bifunctional diaminohydroxyphosphoribosylaminopyrimidine deaminase/5-amino-6-(5-phosphoribosylamino)uracil reductase RibD [Kiloniella sp. b19]|uniref:bifunctional diaminohydroxyphosphoribosylaminopyrimidine deaminase/5-amino-6-(5-phosphoribosylamino)uracil reductase RibD n=1 Tax=Kiloniella sp. GXU_MW_B19 TaxID=3141326 RepID=UPI0031CE9A4E